VAVDRAERRADEPAHVDLRNHPRNLVDVQLHRGNAERVLEGDGRAELPQIVLGVEQEQVTALPEADVDAEELFEALELGDRAQGDADVQLVRELRAEAAGRLARRTGGELVALDEHDVRDPELREVVSRGRPDRAAADDDDVRRLRH
jgi:hypothetical protein